MNACFSFKPGYSDLTSGITDLFVILPVTIIILVIVLLNKNSNSDCMYSEI